MVTPRLLQHVRHKFGRDGCTRLILLVLARVREEGDYCSDTPGTSDLACMNHNTELHERGIDLPAAGIDDVYVVLAHGLMDRDIRLANSTPAHVRAREWYTQAKHIALR